MKVALCVIVKNENLYLEEYVEHYKNLGFDKIFLYDNNDVTGEDPKDVLQKYIDMDFVTVINYRGKKYCQCEAYEECYRTYNTEYDWIAFFDADEFLHIEHFTNINDFLSQEKFNQFKWIYVNWLPYGDNDLINYENLPIKERFKIPANTWQAHIDQTCRKSILRGGISNLIWNIQVPHAHVHGPNSLFGQNGELPLQCCNVLGLRTRPWYECTLDIPECLAECHLKHYSTKSTEEYVYKKLRGYPDYWGHNINLQNIVQDYFKFNTFSVKKLDTIINIWNSNKKTN